jgi:hypothetical protein
MPKYKNGKVVYSRFKVQGLIRSKGHFYFIFKIKNVSTRGRFEKLFAPLNLLRV